MFFVILSHGTGLKKQKNSWNYKQSAETQIIEVIGYYLNVIFLISIVIHNSWNKIILND